MFELKDISDALATLSIHPLFAPIISTFGVVFASWSAMTAAKSARLTSEANELQLLPLLSVEFEGNRSTNKFILKNIGYGPAFDVQIDPWLIVLTDIRQVWELKMKLTENDLIETGDCKAIEATAFINGRVSPVADLMLANLHPNTSSKLPRVKITIQFTNAGSRRYFAIIETGRGGVKIISPSRKLTLHAKIKLFFLTRFKPTLIVSIFRVRWFLSNLLTKNLT